MRRLLDTHIFLWVIAGSPRLTPAVRRVIERADVVYVSAASIREVAIKVRLGKLHADPAEIAAAIDSNGFVDLPVRVRHAAAVAQPASHHSDPFDRLLIAQALVEPLRLMTVDSVLARYSDAVMLA